MGERNEKSGGGVVYLLVSVLISAWFAFFFLGIITECFLGTAGFGGECMDAAESLANERAERFFQKVFSLDFDTLESIENIDHSQYTVDRQ